MSGGAREALLMPGMDENCGGTVELQRGISPAWGHDWHASERGNGEGLGGSL